MSVEEKCLKNNKGILRKIPAQIYIFSVQFGNWPAGGTLSEKPKNSGEIKLDKEDMWRPSEFYPNSKIIYHCP